MLKRGCTHCRFDIEGEVTRCGRDAGAADPPPAAATAAALKLLVDAGAVCIAKSATPPMNLGYELCCLLHSHRCTLPMHATPKFNLVIASSLSAHRSW